MEQETKQCPYCGEEILAVAKKCKHCGEWLEQPKPMTVCPTCGEETPADNPVCQQCGEPISSDTEQPATSAHSLLSSLPSYNNEEEVITTYKSWFSLTTLLFAFIAFVGQFISMYILGLVLYEGAISTGALCIKIAPYWGAAFSILTVWLGFKYSKNFADYRKTVNTLKTWFALSVFYLWWPFSTLFGWMLIKTGINKNPDLSPLMFCAVMFVVMIIVWVVKIGARDTAFETILKQFTNIVLFTAAFLFVAFVISFGFTSLFPQSITDMIHLL